MKRRGSFFKPPKLPTVLRDGELVFANPALRLVAHHRGRSEWRLFENDNLLCSALGAAQILGLKFGCNTSGVAGVQGIGMFYGLTRKLEPRFRPILVPLVFYFFAVHAIPILRRNLRSCMVIV